MKRLTIEEYAMSLARVASKRSEDPYLQVGAVALTEDNRVVACAYNGLAPGINFTEEQWHDRDARLPFMLHAEQNLCSLFERGRVHTVAVTTMPCASCATLLCAHKVKRVLYCDTYTRDARAVKVFEKYGVELSQQP